MPSVSLRDLYAAELHDLMIIEQLLVAELPAVASHATAEPLQRAIENHRDETTIHVDRLRLLIEQLNQPVPAGSSGVIGSLLEDGRRRIEDAERGEVLDAALIAVLQRIEHLEIACYGTVRSYAATLGDDEAGRILQQTLDEERAFDRELTRIAERGINDAAGADLVEEPTRYRSRLRYVSAADLPAFASKERRLYGLDADDLGTVDGLIVESGSGQAAYYVIDSRGWFTGRRYLLPVEQAQDRTEDGDFETPLSRNEIARYPEFSPSAFIAMNDDEASGYSRRLSRAFAVDVHRQPVNAAGRGAGDGQPSRLTLVGPSKASQPAASHGRGRSGAARRNPDPTRGDVATNNQGQEADGESERLVARDDSEGLEPRSTEAPKTTTPRIERYPER